MLSPNAALNQVIEEAEDGTATPVKNVAALHAIVRDGDLGPALGVYVGSKIEVLWHVTEKETEEDVWWSGTLIAKSGKHVLEDESGEKGTVPMYTICYETRPPEFNETSECNICFTDEHQLYDAESDSIQMWRLGGSEWVPSEDDGSEEEESTNRILRAALGDVEEEHMTKIKAILNSNGFLVPEENPTFQMSGGNIEETAENFVNGILGNILKVHGKKLRDLPASTQNTITDTIQNVKTRLITKLTDFFKKGEVLDGRKAQEIVSEIMQEIASK